MRSFCVYLSHRPNAPQNIALTVRNKKKEEKRVETSERKTITINRIKINLRWTGHKNKKNKKKIGAMKHVEQFDLKLIEKFLENPSEA